LNPIEHLCFFRTPSSC